MSYLGIDIGTSHTKILEIENRNNANFLVKFAIFRSSEIYEAMQDGTYAHSKGAISNLKKALNEGEFTTNQAFFTLPDHKIVSKVITLPIIEGDKNIQQAIEFVSEEHLPLSVSEMSIKYTVLSEHAYDPKTNEDNGILAKTLGYGKDKKGTMDVLLVAAPKKLIDNYVFVAKKIGIEVMGLEPNSSAINRIIPDQSKGIPTILLNIGANYTDLVLVVEGNIRFVRDIKFGVLTLTRRLMEELSLNESQAESYLYTYGFDPGHLNGKIREILEPVMNVLIQELFRFQEYVEQRIHFATEDTSNKIRRLEVGGGGALIPNIIMYFINLINLEVQFLDPWRAVNIDLVNEKDMLKTMGPLFTSAAGTVLK